MQKICFIGAFKGPCTLPQAPRLLSSFASLLTSLCCGSSILGISPSVDMILSVSFLRKLTPTSKAICGLDAPDDQFPNSSAQALKSVVFMKKVFPIGNLSLRTVGSFKVCYCVWEVGDKCESDSNFEFVAGTINIVGPNALQELTAVAGVPMQSSAGHHLPP